MHDGTPDFACSQDCSILLVAAIAPAAASGTTGTLTITTDTTLTEDHYGNIVIGAPLPGFGEQTRSRSTARATTVIGSGDGVGVDITGRRNVTVKNCRVAGFGRGLVVSGGFNNRSSRKTLHWE